MVQGARGIRPAIARFQVNRHKLVDLYTEITVAKNFVYSVAERWDRDEYPVTEISMAKLLVGRVTTQVADTCLQLHGGMGYMAESGISRYFRDFTAHPYRRWHRRGDEGDYRQDGAGVVIRCSDQPGGSACALGGGSYRAPGEVVVHRAAGLHQRVHRCGAEEAKASALEVARKGCGLGCRRGHVAPRPLVAGAVMHVDPAGGLRPAARRRRAVAGRRGRCRSSPRSSPDCARC